MSDERINEEFRLQKIDKTKNHLIKEIKQNHLMSRKTHKSLHGFKLH